MRFKPKMIPILILVVFLSGCQSYTTLHENDKNYPPINPIPEGTQVQIHLFYPQKEIDILAKEVRTVNLENKKIEAVVIDELLKGTHKDGLRNVIPNGVKMLSIYTQDSIAYVNFNRELIKERIEEAEEALIIYSIVNSLTSIKNIDKVQILIEGEMRENYNRYKLNDPIGYSYLILELPYNSPITKVEEYYNAFITKDYRKMFEMESAHCEKETRYDIFELYYQAQSLGLVSYDIDNYEIIKYDKEIILLYDMNLYYSDGRIIRTGWQEMHMRFANNSFIISIIKNNNQS